MCLLVAWQDYHLFVYFPIVVPSRLQTSTMTSPQRSGRLRVQKQPFKAVEPTVSKKQTRKIANDDAVIEQGRIQKVFVPVAVETSEPTPLDLPIDIPIFHHDNVPQRDRVCKSVGLTVLQFFMLFFSHQVL